VVGVSERPVAVVTGAARGIGAAVALTLAGDGWDLVLGDVARPDAVPGLSYPLASAAELAQSAQRCRDAGAQVVAQSCDVRDAEQVAELVARATGRLRAAVAVAGIMAADGPAWELTPADLELDLSVNLHGIANLARAAVPVLLQAPSPRQGRVVAVVSMAAVGGLPRLASYAASKHAALGYLRSLAADLGSSGITANAVLPGSTRTELLRRTAAGYRLDSAEEFAANQRIGRLLDPAEVAAGVAWLCSPAASGVTGTELGVHGGFTG
jgi:SDR family mycofactocin-dependent oxidoreductase